MFQIFLPSEYTQVLLFCGTDVVLEPLLLVYLWQSGTEAKSLSKLERSARILQVVF